MKVNKKLIQKYHQGKTTEEEKQVVEKWLNDPDASAEIAATEKELSPELEADIWQNIQKDIKPDYTNQIIINVMKIAACTLIAVIGVYAYQWKFSEKETLSATNMGDEGTKTVQLADLNMELSPKSQVAIQSGFCKYSHVIQFNGIITINAQNDSKLTLIPDIAGEEQEAQQTIKFKKGQTYVVFNYQFRSDNELVVVDRNMLDRLPHALKTKALQEFPI